MQYCWRGSQRCIISSSRCCLNTSETTFPLENYLCNVDPEHTGIPFAGKEPIKPSLGLVWPTLHKKITCVMLAHSPQTSIIYNFFLNLSRSTLHKAKMKAKMKFEAENPAS